MKCIAFVDAVIYLKHWGTYVGVCCHWIQEVSQSYQSACTVSGVHDVVHDVGKREIPHNLVWGWGEVHDLYMISMNHWLVNQQRMLEVYTHSVHINLRLWVQASLFGTVCLRLHCMASYPISHSTTSLHVGMSSVYIHVSLSSDMT